MIGKIEKLVNFHNTQPRPQGTFVGKAPWGGGCIILRIEKKNPFQQICLLKNTAVKTRLPW